ncbi:hypothetical protein YC2023_111898 [Brassica napus]
MKRRSSTSSTAVQRTICGRCDKRSDMFDARAGQGKALEREKLRRLPTRPGTVRPRNEPSQFTKRPKPKSFL